MQNEITEFLDQYEAKMTNTRSHWMDELDEKDSDEHFIDFDLDLFDNVEDYE